MYHSEVKRELHQPSLVIPFFCLDPLLREANVAIVDATTKWRSHYGQESISLSEINLGKLFSAMSTDEVKQVYGFIASHRAGWNTRTNDANADEVDSVHEMATVRAMRSLGNVLRCLDMELKSHSEYAG